MKKPVLVVAPLLIGLVALAGNAMANTGQYKPAAKMRILTTVQIPHEQAESEPPRQSLKQMGDSCLNADTSAHALRRQLSRKILQCRRAEYSVAEQRAAGCSSSDTVRDCNIKLINHCAKPVRDQFDRAVANVMQTCNRFMDTLRRDMGILQRR